MTKTNSSDIFANQLADLTNQFLNCNSDQEREPINAKISYLKELILANSKSAVGRATKVTKEATEKKHYEIADVIGLGYGQKVRWLYRQYKGKELVNEVTALGEFVGLVTFKLNGYNQLGIGFKAVGNFADMIDGRIYGFKLESLREFNLVED